MRFKIIGMDFDVIIWTYTCMLIRNQLLHIFSNNAVLFIITTFLQSLFKRDINNQQNIYNKFNKIFTILPEYTQSGPLMDSDYL